MQKKYLGFAIATSGVIGVLVFALWGDGWLARTRADIVLTEFDIWWAGGVAYPTLAALTIGVVLTSIAIGSISWVSDARDFKKSLAWTGDVKASLLATLNAAYQTWPDRPVAAPTINDFLIAADFPTGRPTASDAWKFFQWVDNESFKGEALGGHADLFNSFSSHRFGQDRRGLGRVWYDFSESRLAWPLLRTKFISRALTDNARVIKAITYLDVVVAMRLKNEHNVDNIVQALKAVHVPG